MANTSIRDSKEQCTMLSTLCSSVGQQELASILYYISKSLRGVKPSRGYSKYVEDVAEFCINELILPNEEELSSLAFSFLEKKNITHTDVFQIMAWSLGKETTIWRVLSVIAFMGYICSKLQTHELPSRLAQDIVNYATVVKLDIKTKNREYSFAIAAAFIAGLACSVFILFKK